MNPKYQKVTTYNKQDDGSILITKKSYYEELQSVIEEIKTALALFPQLREEQDE